MFYDTTKGILACKGEVSRGTCRRGSIASDVYVGYYEHAMSTGLIELQPIPLLKSREPSERTANLRTAAAIVDFWEAYKGNVEQRLVDVWEGKNPARVLTQGSATVHEAWQKWMHWSKDPRIFGTEEERNPDTIRQYQSDWEKLYEEEQTIDTMLFQAGTRSILRKSIVN